MAVLRIMRRRKAQEFVVSTKGQPFAFPDGAIPVWTWRGEAVRAAARCTAEGKGEHVVMVVTERMRDRWRTHDAVFVTDGRR
jgi:hypothetical protein